MRRAAGLRGAGHTYLAASGVALPAGMTGRRAGQNLDTLAAVARGSTHPAGQHPPGAHLAAQVFDDDDDVDLPAVDDLRRLTDVIRTTPGRPGGPGAEVSFGELQAQVGKVQARVRARRALPAGAPVSPADVRELLAVTRLAKASLPAGSGEKVTAEHIAQVAAAVRTGTRASETGPFMPAPVAGRSAWRALARAGRQAQATVSSYRALRAGPEVTWLAADAADARLARWVHNLPVSPGQHVIAVTGAHHQLPRHLPDQLRALITRRAPGTTRVVFTTPLNATALAWARRRAVKSRTEFLYPRGQLSHGHGRLAAAGGWYRIGPPLPGEDAPQHEFLADAYPLDAATITGGPHHLLIGDLRAPELPQHGDVVRPLHGLEVQPPLPFSPSLISEDLADIDITGEPDDDVRTRLRRVLAAKAAHDRIDELVYLMPPVPLAEMRRFLGRAGAGELLADRALRSLTGNQAYHLTVARKKKLIGVLVGPAASDRDLYATLMLLHTSNNADLGELRRDKQLLQALKAGIPADHAQRGWLDNLLADQPTSAEGRAEPAEAAGGEFTLALIDPALAGISVTGVLGGEQLTQIAQAVNRRSPHDIKEALASLEWTALPAAEWGLGRVRVAMRAQARAGGDTGPLLKAAVATLEKVLDWLYLHAAQRAGDPDRLHANTVIPPPWEMPELQAAFSPAAGRGAFVNQLPGEEKPYKAKLRRDFDDDIKREWAKLAGKGQQEHDKRDEAGKFVNLIDPAELAAILAEAKRAVDLVLARLTTISPPPMVPDLPARLGRPARPGNVHDLFAARTQQMKDWGDDRDKFRQAARDELRRYPFRDGYAVASTVAAHNADLGPGPTGELSDEAEAFEEVIDELVNNQTTLDQVLDVWRGYPAEAASEIGQVWLDCFLESDDRRNQWKRWAQFQLGIHEYLHLLAHAAFARWTRDSLGFGTHRYNTAVEGLTSLLTRIVWASVEPYIREPWLRKIVEGPYAIRKDPGTGEVRYDPDGDELLTDPLPPHLMPHPYEYPSIDQAWDVTSRAGIQAILAAYLGGHVAKIAGASELGAGS